MASLGRPTKIRAPIRVLVSVIVDKVAAGAPREEILRNYTALANPAYRCGVGVCGWVDARGHRGFAAENQSFKFKVQEHLPTEYASIPNLGSVCNK